MKKLKLLLFISLVIILTFFSYKSLLKPGYFPMHDDMQPIRVLGMDKCVRDGQMPCRWVPDLGYGYGYPLYIYYPPLVYYLMEAFHLLGFSILASIKIEFILSFIFSGLAMFLLARSLWGDFGGLIAAIFYVYAPYRATDVYSRGAVGEFTALIFLPLIFWAILEFVRQKKTKYLIFLGLSYAGLLLTHNITSLIFTPIVVAWGFFLLWYYRRWEILPQLFLGAVLGVCLAGFFILPAVFEKNLVHVESMIVGYFNYLAHFASIRQLFFSTHWGYGSSEFGPNDDFTFAIGVFHWLFALIALMIGLGKARKKRFSFLVLVFLIAIGLFSAFLAHQRSTFIWKKIALLAYLQFPWRFLTIVLFTFSVAAGAVVSYLRKYVLLVSVLMILGVMMLNVNYFRPADWFDISDQDKLSGEEWQKQITASIFDYLPVFAKAPPGKKAPEGPETIAGEAEVIHFEKGTDWQKGKIRTFSQQARIRLPLFYFPNFELKIDDKKAPIDYQNDLGLITFDIDQGEHDFYVKLKRTPIRILGDLLTVSSLIFVGGWLINEKRKSR